MHFHKFEKIWLTFGLAMIVVFLAVLGVGAFAMGAAPPGDHHTQVDPARVEEIAPFNKPGLRQIGKNEYEAIMVGKVFSYVPDAMTVPVGATVHFTVTSPDVVHGFQIVGTNVNAMIVPGEVNHITHKFTKPGTYLVLCNEYCGSGHEVMSTTIIVL
ncbi:cytochrome c oxidase subunit II [Paenibacillus koleovorans]|uniref:cytochrome c oxidase subunit II n=1 Tax=Paenibacillus koleovorans TaxID=121608 RepID=UPI000FD6CE5F|nr:cytochrome c oxidase subunit II [Paenibacillus koleovorans]